MSLALPATVGYILHERAEEFYGEGSGYLSIKSFFNGQAHYTSGTAHHLIGDQSYLILNHGQAYTIHIQASRPVEILLCFLCPRI